MPDNIAELLERVRELEKGLAFIAGIRPGCRNEDEHLAWYCALNEAERAIADRVEMQTYSRAWRAASDHALAALESGR